MQRTLRAITLLAALMAGLLYAVPVALSAGGPPAAPHFSDVAEDHPDRTYIEYLAARELVHGYPDGRFGPGDALNRAAAAKMAVEVAGLAARKTGQALGFTDLPDDHWGTPYIRTGVEMGMLTGFPDKTFHPGDPLTRAQLAALAIRATRQSERKVPAVQLKDVSSSDWFYKDVMLAIASGMMEAKDGLFRPNETATRADAARAFAQALVYTPQGFDRPLPVVVEVKSGLVEVAQPGQDSFAAVTGEATIPVGARVRTGGASSAMIRFADGSAVLLDSLTEITLNKSRGADLVTGPGLEELDMSLTKGSLVTTVTPRLTQDELQAYAPYITAFLDKKGDARSMAQMQPRIAAAAGSSGENLPANATRLLVFSDPGSLEPGDAEGADLTVVLADDSGEPVNADAGPVTLQLLTDAGTISNPAPVIPQGYNAVTVKLTPPDEEPEDAKTRVTAVAGDVSASLTIPTAKVNWWQALFAKKVRAKVRMPWSVASVRGSSVLARVTATLNSLGVLAGDASLENPVTGDNQRVGNNQNTGIGRPDAPPSNPAPLSGNDLKRLAALAQFFQRQSEEATLKAASDALREAASKESEELQALLDLSPKDTAAPSISISSPSSGTITGKPQITVSGSASDDVELDSVSVNGSSVGTSASGRWSSTVTLKPGPNTISATATDRAGNSSSDSVTVQFDAANPTITLSGPEATKEKQVTVTGEVTVPGGLKKATVGGKPVGEGPFTVTVDLKPGKNAITAEVQDQQDRTASASIDVVSATLPPVLSVSFGPDKVAKKEYILSGRAEAQFTDLQSVTVNGQGYLFDDSGAFLASLTLKPGPNTISVAATDAAGNTASVSRIITWDASLPSVKISSPKEGLITKESSVTVSGKIDAAAGIKSLSISGGSASADENGNFSAKVALKEGPNTITVTVVDELDKTASESRTVILATKPPTLSISAPTDGFKAAKKDLVVSGSAQAAFGELKSVRINGKAAVVGADGSFTGSVTLKKGDNTITVTATDSADNTATETRTVRYNPEDPTLTVTAPAGGLITKSQKVPVTGQVEKAEDLSTIQIKINGGTASLSPDGSFSGTVTLVPGKNTITISLSEDAGGASETRTVIYADKPPTLSVSEPENGLMTPKPKLPVSGTAMTSYGAPAKVTVNGQAVSVSDNGSFSATVELKPGPNTISVSAADEAGNASSASRSVTYKPNLPSISISTPSPGEKLKEASVRVAGHITTPVGLKSVTVNGVSASFSTEGDFSATVKLLPGANSITVSATDIADGTATASVSVTLSALSLQVSAPSSVDTDKVTVSVSVAGAAPPGTVSVGGRSFSLTGDSGTFSAEVTLQKGSNTIEASASDSAGGQAKGSVSVTFTPVPPTVSASGPATVTAPSATISGSASSRYGDLVVSAGGQSFSLGTGGSFTATVSLNPGSNTFSVTATDKYGSASKSVSITYNPPPPPLPGTAPRVTILYPEASREVRQLLTLSGHFEADLPLKKVTYQVDDPADNTKHEITNQVFTENYFGTSVELKTPGLRTITVEVTDNADRKGSATVTVLYHPIALTVDLVQTPSPLQYSDTVRVTATLTFNGQPLADKAIQFSWANSADTPVIGQTNSSGIAQVDLPATVTGSQTINAAFIGDNDYHQVNINSGSINLAPEEASLTYEGDVEVNGGAVNLSATVSDTDSSLGDISKAGTVQFTVRHLDGTPAGTFTGTVGTDGVATATGTELPNEPFNIEVSLLPSAYYFASPVSAHAKATTSLSLDSAAGQYSDQVTLSATLTPGVAGKSVEFTVDGTSVGFGTTTAGGVAKLDYTITEAAGNHTLGARFTADDDYTGSTATNTLAVSREDATLTYSGDTVATGSTISLSATVTDAADGSRGTIDNAGRVQFVVKKLDGTVAKTFDGPVINGAATAAGTGLADVPYSIEVSLVENEYYTAVTAIGHAKATAGLAVGTWNRQYSDPIYLSAQLTPSASNKAVVFTVGDITLGPVMTDPNGNAMMSYAIALKAGSYTVGASFAGDGDYTGATGTGSLTVTQEDARISYTGDKVVAGGPINLGARVSEYGSDFDDISGTISNAGIVQFVVKQLDGTVVDTRNGPVDSDGNAVATTGTLPNQPYDIEVSLLPNGYYTAPAKTDHARGTLHMTMAGAEGQYSDHVTLSASVSPAVAGKAVAFKVDGDPAGSGTTNADGLAAVDYVTTKAAGNHTIGATFTQDADYTGTWDDTAVDTDTLVVAREDATLTYTGDTVVTGGVISLSAALSDTDGSTGTITNAGSVQFVVKKLDGNVAGTFTGPVNISGVATTTGTGLTNEPYSIDVSLVPNNYYAAATTSAYVPASASLTVADAGGQYSDHVTLSATLSPAVSGRSVEFTVDGAAVGSGTTDAGGVATLDYAIAKAAGSYTIGAKFAAETYYTGAIGSGTLNVTPEVVSLAYTGDETVTGGTVNLSATVTDSDGSTGTVSKAENVQFVVKRLDGTVAGSFTGAVSSSGVAVAGGMGLLNQPYNIEVSLPANGYYTATAPAPVHAKATSSLTVAGAAGQYSDHVTLSATLYPAVFGKSVEFTVDGAAVGTGKTDAGGVATLDYAITTAEGSHVIGASFTTDADYIGATDTDTLAVTREVATITYDGVQVVIGGAINLRATVAETDSSPGNISAAGTVQFVVKDQGGTVAGTYTGPVDAGGVATANATGLATKPYNIEVSLLQNSYYTATTATVHAKASLQLAMAGATGQYSDHVTVYAAFPQAVSGKSVAFTVNGVSAGSVKTDAEGVATVDYAITGASGNYTVMADFTGDEDYVGTTVMNTLAVTPENATLSYTGDMAVSGVTLNLKALLTEAQDGSLGQIAKAGTIRFTANQVQQTGDIVTKTPVGYWDAAVGADGTAAAPATIPGAGVYEIQVSLLGNGYYIANPITQKIQTIAILNTADVSASYGDTVTLKATLTSVSGAPLAGKTVSFSVAGVTVGSDVTDGLGVATYQYYVTQGADAYTIGASFAGDETYSTSSSSGTLAVCQAPATLVYQGDTQPTGGAFLLQGRLNATQGSVPNSVSLQFQVKQGDNEVVTYSANVDATGTATVSPSPVLPPGGYKIILSLPANQYYTASQVTYKTDTTPPKITVYGIDSVADSVTVTGSVDEPNLQSVSVSEVTDTGTIAGTVTLTQNTFSSTLNLTTSAGPYAYATIQVDATDQVGNSSVVLYMLNRPGTTQNPRIRLVPRQLPVRPDPSSPDTAPDVKVDVVLDNVPDNLRGVNVELEFDPELTVLPTEIGTDSVFYPSIAGSPTKVEEIDNTNHTLKFAFTGTQIDASKKTLFTLNFKATDCSGTTMCIPAIMFKDLSGKSATGVTLLGEPVPDGNGGTTFPYIPSDTPVEADITIGDFHSNH